MNWQPIDTAPKDGRAILLLSMAYEDSLGEWGPRGIIQHKAKVVIGHWWPDGTSWVDERGMLTGPAYTLAKTGTWKSGGGWFQPNEVTHWMPLPPVPPYEVYIRDLERTTDDPAFLPVMITQMIRTLRKREGITQGELAKRIGTRQSCISRLEMSSGDIGTTTEMLRRIARALNAKLRITFEPLDESQPYESVAQSIPMENG